MTSGVAISARVRELGYDLPIVSKPAGSYLSTKRAGEQLFLAGQISKRNGKPAFAGKVGRVWSLAQARAAAQLAALDLIAQIADAAGDNIEAVQSIARLGGFVNATEDFTQISDVVDAASEIVAAVFGERGQHTRTAIGVATLPRGAAVEIDAIVILNTP